MSRIYHATVRRIFSYSLLLLFLFMTPGGAIAQKLISIDPDSATAGTQVKTTIIGDKTTFTKITGPTRIQLRLGISTINSDSFQTSSDLQMDVWFTLPISASGIYDLRVNAGAGWLTLAKSFTILKSATAPTLISIDPDSAYQGQAVMVAITSQFTHFSSASSQSVRLTLGMNNITADSAIAVNDTLLNAYFNIPIKAIVGLYGIRVTNSIDGTLQIPSVFYIIVSPYSPKLISIDPDSSIQGSSVNTTINGQFTHFSQGKTITARLQYGTTYMTADKVSFVNDTTLNAHFNVPFSATLGTYELRVQDSIDGQLILSNLFTVLSNPNQPKLVSISPDNAFQGEKIKMTINGSSTNFGKSTGLTAILFFSNPVQRAADSTKAVNDSVMFAWFTVPFASPIGLYDVIVQNSIDGQLSLIDVFTVKQSSNPPAIVMVDPDSVMQGKSAIIKVYGKRTQFTNPKPPTARLFQSGPNQFAADSVKVINDSILDAYFTIKPTAVLGVYNMIVIGNVEGTMTLPGSVWIIPAPTSPQIGVVTPNKGMLGKKVAVSVNGKNTTFTKGVNQSVRLQRNGSPIVNPDSSKVIHDSLIIGYFTIAPTTITGPYNVQVSGTIHGTLMLPNGFEIIPSPSSPQIVKISPTKSFKNSSLNVSFITSNTLLTQSVNLRPVLSYAPNNNILSDTFSIVHDSLVVAHFVIPANAVVGLYDAVLQNTPTGLLMLNDCFEVTDVKKVPKIKSIDPDSVYLGQDVNIKIYCGGTSFVKAIQVDVAISGPGGATLSSDLVKVINDSVISAHFLIPAAQTTGVYSVAVSDKFDSIFSLSNALVIYDKTISIEDEKISEVKLYPNPANDQVLITSGEKILFVSLYNLQGELILIEQNIDENEVVLNLGQYNKGIYLVKITSENGSTLKKLLLK